jgi:type IV pilus assembly protein PilY1
VVESLNDIYNVGLMMFHETGGDDDNVVGSYVRYAVRQMTEDNKAVLSSVVNGLGIIADKSNNAVTALAMYEAYLYYAGAASYASYGKAKTDYKDNSDNPANSLGDHALGSSPNASTLFNSPISNGCQKNFIIYISNGPANENSHVLGTSEEALADLTGISPPNVTSISPDGQEGNWGDEWADYMANSDVNDAIGETQNVFTYTLEVDPGTTGGGPDMTALLKSMANKGQGRYFAVSSSNNGQAIVNALNQIFQEVQAVNSVFAATTLPVSVNVRGTNLNQVYVGMFRPDSQKLPRWYGNLKCYQLGLDDSTGELYLTDTNDIKAENSTTGFVTDDATSFWTESSSFWNFRPAEDNGSGGNSDLPDGDLVEKGGVAQKLRTDFATSQAGRNLLTCTGTCLTNGSLTNFDADNSDITSASLLLDVQSVSVLSGLLVNFRLSHSFLK